MKGAYFIEPKHFEIWDRPTPTPDAGDVLVRNVACGVCGTDVHIYHGEPGSADVAPPVVLGHEYAGIVEAVGEGVTAVAPGDHVTIDPNIYCGVCRACRDGKKQVCESLRGIGVNCDGGFAEYCVVPASQLFILDPSVDFETGAMAEPLACCIHGIDRAAIKPGNTVVVIGGGTIGQIMVQLAKLSGAGRIILSEPVAMRREVGLSLGADNAFDPLSVDPAEEVRRITGRDGADIIIECVGVVAATKQAFDCAARGATVMLFSVPKADAAYDLPLFDVFFKELTIHGSFINPDTHARAVELINCGKINVAPLITHRFPIERVEDAILMQMSDKSIKVVVRADM